ncbi:MAG: LysM peptidoglycan-binding domain-containing protein [Streptomyces sp.]|nr:LysM peptidoglycan-binding domain-containing protein [Streptomyces sp.]
MPHSPATRPARTGSAAAAAARALLSGAVLLVLLVGLPVLLWWATRIVGPDGIRSLDNLLTTQDSGQTFLLALAVVGWVGWGMFALSVLVEIPAQLAGRTAPSLRFVLGQRTAATLVGAVFLVLPAGTALASAAAPAQAATPAATATLRSGSSTSVVQRSAVPAAAHDVAEHDTVRYTVRQVRPAESLWSIAEQRLGDGNRWKEIADLNDGRTMADGTTFRSDAPIQPGWILELPVDARSPQATPATASQDGTTAAEQPGTYTVVAGDSLSAIAQQELGDAGQWPEIFELNKGHAQPGGHHLTDPDRIYPREQLQLPGGPSSERPAPKQSATPHRRPEQHPSTHPAPVTSSPATAAPAPSAPVTPAPSATSHTIAPSAPASPQAPAPQPSATPPATAAPQSSAAPDTSTAADSTSTGSRMPLFAVGGGLLAAAVLATVGLRRSHQQRRRGIGRRIALPTGSAAATERALRATEQPDAPGFIDGALRTAAVHLAADGRELPDLAAAVYSPAGLELLLSESAPPVAPFSADAGDLARWLCPPHSGELLASARTDMIEAPYPALVTVGSTADGRTVLVDLEHYGMVVLTGPARREVLRALALELATSRYAEQLDIAVTDGACPGLPALLPEWFTVYDTAAGAAQAAGSHHATQAQALAALGVDGLRQARLRDDQASAWTPHLLLADEPDSDVVAELASLAGQVPATASAVITAAGTVPGALPASAWLLNTAADQVRLPDVDLTVTLQVLPDDAYADVVALLAESDASQPDVQAPAPKVGGPADLSFLVLAQSEPAAPQVAVPEQTSPPAVIPPDEHQEATPEGGLLAGLADFGDLADAPLEPEPAAPAADVESKSESDPGPARDAEAGTESETDVETESVPFVPALAPPAQMPAPADPLIRVLGPVDVIGVKGTTDSKYLRTVTEIAAWMVLHPGLDHHALDEAIWPGRDVSRKTRNPWISRLRALLGSAADGTKYLPAIATTDDARYRLAEQVTSDWQLFQDLAAKGFASSGDQADDLLRAALDLVRGRPFSAIPPRRYIWAEHPAQDMIAAIVDVAAVLGERRLALADPRGALWATTKGLDVAPEAEHLYRITFRAHAALGDHEGLDRAASHLERLCDALGSDMEDATVELLRSLLTSAPLR